ncbi:hypothetical protein C8J57DRAFT_1255142 [Mycena rebaudengoi]|nr:hypothetical protein C8J57DRAFT_1255142 [Mycena rebaudengoi]
MSDSWNESMTGDKSVVPLVEFVRQHFLKLFRGGGRPVATAGSPVRGAQQQGILRELECEHLAQKYGSGYASAKVCSRCPRNGPSAKRVVTREGGSFDAQSKELIAAWVLTLYALKEVKVVVKEKGAVTNLGPVTKEIIVTFKLSSQRSSSVNMLYLN